MPWSLGFKAVTPGSDPCVSAECFKHIEVFGGIVFSGKERKIFTWCLNMFNMLQVNMYVSCGFLLNTPGRFAADSLS